MLMLDAFLRHGLAFTFLRNKGALWCKQAALSSFNERNLHVVFIWTVCIQRHTSFYVWCVWQASSTWSRWTGGRQTLFKLTHIWWTRTLDKGNLVNLWAPRFKQPSGIIIIIMLAVKTLHSIVVFDMLNYCLRFKNQHISGLLGNSAMNSPLSRPTVHITGFYTLTLTPLHIQDFFPWGGILKKKQQLLRRQLLIAWKIETSLLLRASLLNAQLWCVERNTIHRLRCCY